MITKQKLEELIEQRRQIFAVAFYNCKENTKVVAGIAKIYLVESHEINFDGCKTAYDLSDLPYFDKKYLFETLEEADAEANLIKEFENIKRTERLDLPLWGEFNKNTQLADFVGKNKNRYKLLCYNLINDDNSKQVIDILEYTDGDCGNIFREPLTKENYILACRKCKELFLGVENGTTS